MELLLVYMAAWLLATGAAYLLGIGRREEGRLVVNPLMVMLRTPIVFRVFDRLQGSRIAALLLDAGVASSYIAMMLFYYNIGLGLLMAAETGRPTGMITPIIPGATIGVTTFLYMLPGLSAAIILHETFHALAARHAGIPIRSSGILLLLGLLPAAFVEPDEEALRRAPRRARLRVYAAGILANILLFLAFQGILYALSSQGSYIVIVDVVKGSSAANASIKPYTVAYYIEINGTQVKTVNELGNLLREIREQHNGTLAKVALAVRIATPEGIIEFVKPRAPPGAADSQVYNMIGLRLYEAPAALVNTLGPQTATRTTMILIYAVVVNLGLALINAAPLFITDGTHIARETIAAIVGDIRAETIAKVVSAITLALVLPNLSL